MISEKPVQKNFEKPGSLYVREFHYTPLASIRERGLDDCSPSLWATD